MLNKTVIAVTAATILASASAALAYESPENRLGDRYPFLEQAYAPVSAQKVARTNVMYRQASSLVQYSNEAPENRIGDRYPFLEQALQPSSSSRSAGRYLGGGTMTRQVASSNSYVNEAPENRIGDRYPLLEPQVASQRTSVRQVAAGRASTGASIR